jgi:hypothetical protein
LASQLAIRKGVMSAANGKSKKKASGPKNGGEFMGKKFIFAFVLIIATAVVLLYNMKGIFTPPRIDVDLVFTSIKGVYTSIVFLAFTVIGVLIGLFIK